MTADAKVEKQKVQQYKECQVRGSLTKVKKDAFEGESFAKS